MKNLKLFSIVSLIIFMSSCSEQVVSNIEKTLVVEQIEANLDVNCDNCLEKDYRFKVKLRSQSGEVYYYTNYKHEVGDTLISSFEFYDTKKNDVRERDNIIDSLVDVNEKLNKKNESLSLHNELLLGIIQENAVKQK